MGKSQTIDLNENRHDGNTAFTLACCYGKTDVAKLLLDHPRSLSIDLNAKNWNGLTALMLACMYGGTDVVEVLLNHPRSQNIDLHAKNDGLTALALARLHEKTAVCELIESVLQNRL